MKYRAEIDGLRAIAVIPVILFHAGFAAFSGGFVGVDIFFVISGYLITTLIAEELDNKSFNIVNFYERRARRILPALFFVMLFCIPFAWTWMLASEMKSFSQSLVAVSFFASNILFWRESGYFDLASEEKPLLHTWSLAVEEQYYVLFPIILFLSWRFGKNKVFWLIAVMASVSFLLSEWGWRNQPTANFYLAPTRAWELLSGSLAAFIVRKRGVEKNSVVSLLGLLAIVISIFIYDETTPFPSVFSLVPIIGTVIIILFAEKATLTARILSTKVLVSIGFISYSAYLWHQPLFAFTRIKMIEQPSLLFMSALSVLSLLLAWFSWKYVETPFRDRGIFDRTKIFLMGFLATFLFAGIGLAGHLTNGYISLRSYLPSINREKAISAVYEERQTAIRSGICHFNRRGKYQQLSEFLENWDCIDVDNFPSNSNVLITGDSHSADKALSLRSNEVGVIQLGGAGCVLEPSSVGEGREYCKDILEFSKSLIRSNKVDSLFLSNRFSESELSEKYLQAIFDYWSDVDSKVYLWSPMPNFELQLAAYLQGSSKEYLPRYNREKIFFSIVDNMDVPENFVIVKTSTFWCPFGTKDNACSSFTDSSKLMVDGDHLSVEGAKIFGDRVLKSDIFSGVDLSPALVPLP